MDNMEDHADMEEDVCRVPLLTSSPSYRDGCPGCRLDRKKATSHGALPLKDLFIVALLSLANNVPISSLFSYVYFLVQDYGIAKSMTQIGMYVGFLGSALLIGRFITSLFWGVVADKYGHKPVIFIGSASVFIFLMVFSFSTNYWTALMSRFLIGAGNGMPATLRAYSFEICSTEHQALSLAVVGTMWGVGLIIGPAIGGYLAEPSEKLPSIFPSGSLFDKFPYALPSVCIAVIPLLGFVSCIWLPESLHNHSESDRNLGNDIHSSDGSVDAGITTSVDAAVKNGIVQHFKSKENYEEKKLWRNWGFMAGVSLNALWILYAMAFAETFPLWAVSPKVYGGLDFTTTEVANVLAVSGVGQLVLQLFLLPRTVKAFGTIQMMRVTMLLNTAVTAVFPLMPRLQGVTLWTLLLSLSVVRSIIAGCNITAGFILINNAVVTAQRGVANGVSTTAMSGFQAVGPASAGIIFTWAEQRVDASFLPGMWMMFSILSALSFLCFLATFEPLLPRSLNKPISEG